MARYEVAVATPIVFCEGWMPPGAPEAQSFHFHVAQRDFTWHAGNDTDWPVISTEHEDDPQDRAAAAEAVNRVLSALAYRYDVHMEAVVSVSSGIGSSPRREWIPVVSAPRRGTAPYVATPIGHLFTEDSEKLRLTLAFVREARSSSSPFYRFLAFWNGLEAICGSQNDRRRLIESRGAETAERMGRPEPQGGWEKYLRGSSRNAIAHVVRRSGAEVIDPDLPTDRERLAVDAELLLALLRAEIQAQFPYPVTSKP